MSRVNSSADASATKDYCGQKVPKDRSFSTGKGDPLLSGKFTKIANQCLRDLQRQVVAAICRPLLPEEFPEAMSPQNLQGRPPEKFTKALGPMNFQGPSQARGIYMNWENRQQAR